MEKYIELIKIVVPQSILANTITQELKEIETNPLDYVQNSDRMITEEDDYLWLALVDLLIANNFAFEIDWKDEYHIAKEGTEKLLLKWSFVKEDDNEENFQDLEAEEFFPLLNEQIKGTNYQIFNMDIDSDSYVTVMTTSQNEEMLLALDSRIRKY